jgi:hypothetical protein
VVRVHYVFDLEFGIYYLIIVVDDDKLLVDEFLQMTALSNIEAKKKFEFLEAVSGSMDAHLRYFKQASFPEDI